MTESRFPALVRLNKFGAVTKVVVPDLFLDLTPEIPFYSDIYYYLENREVLHEVISFLGGDYDDLPPDFNNVKAVLQLLEPELQRFVDFWDIKDLDIRDESHWTVKKNGFPIQWEEMSCEVPQSRYRCRSVMTPTVIFLYIVSTLIDAFLGYFTDVVNLVPIAMAIASVITDVITTTPDFFASGLTENSNAFFSCAAKIIDTGYALHEDFDIEERFVGKPAYYVLGGIFALAQGLSTIASLLSSWNNYMYQYDQAYDQGYVPSAMSYDFYKALAMLGFVFDNAFQLLVPFSTAVTVGPKVGKALENIGAWCRNRRAQKPSDLKIEVIEDEKADKKAATPIVRVDDMKSADRTHHRSGRYAQLGTFGDATYASQVRLLSSESANSMDEKISKRTLRRAS